MPWEQIRDCALDIAVMDFDTIGRNEMICRLILGCKYFIQENTILKICENVQLVTAQVLSRPTSGQR